MKKAFMLCLMAISMCTMAVAQTAPKIEQNTVIAKYDFTKSKNAIFAWPTDIKVNIKEEKIWSEKKKRYYNLTQSLEASHDYVMALYACTTDACADELTDNIQGTPRPTQFDGYSQQAVVNYLVGRYPGGLIGGVIYAACAASCEHVFYECMRECLPGEWCDPGCRAEVRWCINQCTSPKSPEIAQSPNGDIIFASNVPKVMFGSTTGSFVIDQKEKMHAFITISNQRLKAAGWKYSKLEIVKIDKESISFNIIGTNVLNTWDEYCGTTNWIPGQCNGCEQAMTSTQLLRLNFLAQGYQYVCIIPRNYPSGCELGWCGQTTCYQVVASNDWNCEMQ